MDELPRNRPARLWVWMAVGAGFMALVLLLLGIAVVRQVTDFGDVRIETSEPVSQVRLKVDGEPRRWGDDLSLRAGGHDLEAAGEGFEPVRLRFNVGRGPNEPILVVFKPARNLPLKGEEVRQIPCSGGIYFVALSPDGRYYLASGDTDTVRVWSVDTGQEVRQFPGFFAAFTSDGKQLVTGSKAHAQFHAYRTDSWESAGAFKDNEDLDDAWLLPKTDLVVTATTSGYALWTLEGDKRKRWDCDPAKSSLLFTPDGKHLLTRLDGAAWQAIDTGSLAAVPGFKGVAGTTRQLSGFTPEGQLVYGSTDKKLVFYNVADGKEVRAFDLGDSPVDGLILSPDGKRLLTAHKDHSVRVWDVLKGTEVCRLFTPEVNRVTAKALAVSADGRFACAGGVPGRVYLWRLP